MAAAIITFAFDTSTVNGVSAPSKSHGNAVNLDELRERVAR